MALTYWNGDGFMDMLAEEYDSRLGLAAEVVATRMRNHIGEDYPPASAPGTPPHRRTGELQAAVEVTKPKPLTRFIGADTPYTLALELGRKDGSLAARPFMLRSLMESTQDIYQIVIEGGDARPGMQPFAASFAPGFAPTPGFFD